MLGKRKKCTGFKGQGGISYSLGIGKFFHLATAQRRNVNKILRLKIEDRWLEDEKEIEYAFTRYYESLFQKAAG